MQNIQKHHSISVFLSGTGATVLLSLVTVASCHVDALFSTFVLPHAKTESVKMTQPIGMATAAVDYNSTNSYAWKIHPNGDYHSRSGICRSMAH